MSKNCFELMNKTASNITVNNPIFETPKVEEIKTDIINPICDEVVEKKNCFHFRGRS